MSDERTRRVGQNEALYRQVNERIEGLNEAFGTMLDDFRVVCECGNLECMEQISVSREAYERIRANPHWFFVKPGHETPDVEHPIEEHGDYVLVQKLEGEPRRVAERTDRRS